MLTQTALFQEPSMPQWHCVLKLANVNMKNVTESGGCTYFASGYTFLCRWWWLSFAILQMDKKTFVKRCAIFFLHSKNSEYPRIFRVTGANKSAQILLSNDLVNTNVYFPTTSRITFISRPCELLPLQTLLVLVSLLYERCILSLRQTNIRWQSPICTYFIHKLNGIDTLTQNLGAFIWLFLGLVDITGVVDKLELKTELLR